MDGASNHHNRTAAVVLGQDSRPPVVRSSTMTFSDPRGSMPSQENKPAPPRKGANGVLLKKFEATLQQLFSSSTSSDPSRRALETLTPHYSIQPPRLSELETEELINVAKHFWKETGLLEEPGDSTAFQCGIDDNSGNIMSSPWPFDGPTALPSCGRVRKSQDPRNANGCYDETKTTKTKTGKDTGGVGDIMHAQRAWRKEIQLANLIHCVLALLPDNERASKIDKLDGRPNRAIRIVDFAGGTGHLAVPLALLLPHCDIVCVDLKKWSLDLLHKRVDGRLNDKVVDQTSVHESKEVKSTKTLPNLSTYYGSIQSYPDRFDIGIALHACGEASDWVLRKCLERNASFVICSCCCGKLRREAGNPYVYHSTGGNEKEIRYPQSTLFASLGEDAGKNDDKRQVSGDQKSRQITPDTFDEIAKAADYSELGDLRKPRNACRRVAKSLVEWDRLLFARECLRSKDRTGFGDGNGGCVVLTRMLPWEASTKNDIIIGWCNRRVNPYRLRGVDAPDNSVDIPRDKSCDGDFEVALHHLFGMTLSSLDDAPGTDANDHSIESAHDWSTLEEIEIKRKIESFVRQTTGKDTTVFRFPMGMGSRQRKLIHYVAEKMGLDHWGEGKKDREKTVVVALKGNRRQQNED
ncbi:hypothetical protein HJC23_003081 [Cyclotella cryptica]|uniref:R3H domain-containing protein n=1 Tax=Cyclotella cryptica TaxID=29204 RepID=A0ABD3P8E5_9STRA|eukprot:CCRYP_017657-RA/>CCRYP_017657-RA protein AED:0.00 eAED:0.00 QI:11/-1/1/1/-1/1/1/46/636